MKFIRNVFTLLVVALTLLVGVLFALQNQVLVPLDLLVIRFEEQSLAVWVLVAFLAGGLLGVASSFGVALRARRAERRLHKQLAQRSGVGIEIAPGNSSTAGGQPALAPGQRLLPSTAALGAPRD